MRDRFLTFAVSCDLPRRQHTVWVTLWLWPHRSKPRIEDTIKCDKCNKKRLFAFALELWDSSSYREIVDRVENTKVVIMPYMYLLWYTYTDRKMQWPSLSVILSQIFLAYVVYSIYSLSLLFVSPVCEDGKPCLRSYLSERPQLNLYVYSSIKRNPLNRDTDLVYSAQNFNYNQAQIMYAFLQLLKHIISFIIPISHVSTRFWLIFYLFSIEI